MTGILGRLAMLTLLALAGGCATTPQWEHYTASNRIESPEKGFTLQPRPDGAARQARPATGSCSPPTAPASSNW